MSKNALQQERSDLVARWAKSRVQEFRAVGLHAGVDRENQLPCDAQSNLNWFRDEFDRLSGLADALRCSA